jgi:hypothetical protein
MHPSLTVNLGLRYEYVSAPKEREDRIDYGIGADTDNYAPRLSAAWTPPASTGWLRWLSGGATGDAAVRGGFGIAHGRVFQSVFSQTGASLRTNPPNALSRTYSTLPGLLNVSDPSLGFVFVPGPQTTRHSITIASPELEMPETRQWSLTYERKLPFDSSLRINYNGNHIPNNLKYALGNLPLSPLNGPVVVADHPNNAPAAGFPDLRGKTIDSRRRGHQLCRHGACPGSARTRRARWWCRSRQRDQPARAPHQRAAPGSALYVEPHRQQRRQVLVRRDSVRMDQTAGDGLQITTSYTRSRSLDTTSEATFVGAGDSNQQGPNAAYAKGYSRFHTPHRFSFNSTYIMPFMRIGATFLATCSAAGRSRAWSGSRRARHSRCRRPGSTWTSTALRRRARSCWIRPSWAAPSTIHPRRVSCCR